jgi:hypothetical protein
MQASDWTTARPVLEETPMKQLIWVLLLGALTFPATGPILRAQTARQGDRNASYTPTAFHSPMVLETPFVLADRAMWAGTDLVQEYNALGKYTCDGLALRGRIVNKHTGEWQSGLWMKAKERAGGKLEITIRVLVRNPKHNHDKHVTIFFEVIDGDQVVATTTLGPVEVEDKGWSQGFSTKLVLPTDALKDDPPMKLRITMTAKDY